MFRACVHACPKAGHVCLKQDLLWQRLKTLLCTTATRLRPQAEAKSKGRMEETLPSSCLQPNKGENAPGRVAEGLSTQTPREADSGNCPPSASSLLVQHKGNLNRTLHCTLYAGCTRWIVWFRNRFLNSIVASSKLHIQLTFLSRKTEGKYMDLCLALLLKMRDLSYSLVQACHKSLRTFFQFRFSFPAGNTYSFTALDKLSLQWSTLLFSLA